MKRVIGILVILAAALLPACMKMDDLPEAPTSNNNNINTSSQKNDPSQKQKINFPVTVTRDGEEIPQEAITKGDIDTSDKLATMDKDRPFGLIAIDADNHSLLLDNVSVFNNGSGGYSGYFDQSLWEIPSTVTFSAYYPYVRDVNYEDSYETYAIPYTVQETEAGPLVSKTVERAIDQLNMIPLEFQHITNDIGYKICDVTTDPQLQGLIHLRKVTATNVASAGIFVNDIALSRGIWHRQGFYRDIVVFEGDAVVGVGMENEKFIGKNSLVDRMADSNRYYSIPDEILIGKQTIEVASDEVITFYDPWGTENVIDNNSYNAQSLTVFKPAEAGKSVQITFETIDLNQYSASYYLYMNVYDGIADSDDSFTWPTTTSGITSSSTLTVMEVMNFAPVMRRMTVV